jgi:hypothetical protein
MVDAPLATQALQFLIDDTIETEFHDQAHPQGLAFVPVATPFLYLRISELPVPI